MIDRETWLILADRCVAIRRLRQLRVEEEAERERITLVFDSHDQATVLTLGST